MPSIEREMKKLDKSDRINKLGQEIATLNERIENARAMRNIQDVPQLEDSLKKAVQERNALEEELGRIEPQHERLGI